MLQVENDSEVKFKFEAVGSSIEQLGEKSKKAAESADKVQVNFKDAATSLIGAADKAFTLYTQFDNLEKIELRIAQAEKNVNSTRASLIDSQKALDELVKKGITTGSDYESAQLKVKAAEEELLIAKEKVTQAQGDLSQEQLKFVLSVVPHSIDIVSGLSKGLQQLGLLTKITNTETGKSSFAFSAATLSMAAHKIAAGASALATHGLALATKLLHVAMGPVGWIILGVSTGLALFATNAFGVRDAINAAGKAIGDAIPILRPLLEMLSSLANTIFPDATKEAAQFDNSIVTLGSSVPTATATLSNFGAAMVDVDDSIRGMHDSIEVTVKRVQTFDDYMQELTGSTEEARRQNLYFVQSTGLVTDAASLSNRQLDLAADFLRDQQAETERMVQDNFDLVASHTSLQQALSMTSDQLAKQAQKYRDVEEAANKSKSGRKSSDPFDLFERATGRKPGKGAYVNERGNIVEPHAKGGTIYEPTLMLGMRSGKLGIMAEAGPETIVPAGARSAGGGGRPIMITVITTLDGREVARTVNKYQAENV